MEVTLGAAIVESVVGIAIDRGIKWLEERNNQQTLLDVFVRSFERSFEEYRLIHDDLRPLSLDQDRLRTLLTGNFAFASDVREMSTNDRLRQISNLLHEHHVVMGDHNLTDDELKKFIVRIIQHAQIIAGQLIDENQLLSNAYARQSLDEINQTVHGNTNSVYINPLNSLRFVLNKIKKDKINLKKDFYVFTGSTVGVVPIKGKGIYFGNIDKLGSVKTVIKK